MQEFFPILIVLGIALAIVVGILGYLQREARRKALAAFAASRGMSFDPGEDSGLEDRFPDFECLRQGRSRYAYNRVFGPWNGRDCLLFDYRYVTGQGKNRKTHHFSAVIMASNVPLKPLLIRPEGFFDKVGAFFGADDIDFESAEFSRQFFVKSPDRKWAYDVIHARTMEFLLACPRHTVQFDRGHVIVSHSATFEVSQFVTAAGMAEGILDRMPEYLVRQQQGQA